MTIAHLYRTYDIMPTLQQHMFRVAAVAKYMCTHFNGPPIDTTLIVAACLLHDMGNILKFDLTRFPDFLEPKGLMYWEKVQDKFRERYGANEHVATELILEEIGVVSRVKELVQSIGFFQAQSNVENSDFEKKMCDYADTRVDPHGIVSLEDRLKDLHRRYIKLFPSQDDLKRRDHFAELMYQLEGQVFAHCTARPEEITNEALNGTITSLAHFVVPLKEELAES